MLQCNFCKERRAVLQDGTAETRRPESVEEECSGGHVSACMPDKHLATNNKRQHQQSNNPLTKINKLLDVFSAPPEVDDEQLLDASSGFENIVDR